MENKTSKNSKKLIIQCVILFLMLLVVAFSGQIFAEGDIVNTDMVAQKPSLEHILEQTRLEGTCFPDPLSVFGCRFCLDLSHNLSAW